MIDKTLIDAVKNAFSADDISYLTDHNLNTMGCHDAMVDHFITNFPDEVLEVVAQYGEGYTVCGFFNMPQAIILPLKYMDSLTALHAYLVGMAVSYAANEIVLEADNDHNI